LPAEEIVARVAREAEILLTEATNRYRIAD
jgi:hypothetical protein